MFNQTRTFILIALFAVGYLLSSQWMQDYHTQPEAPTASETAPASDSDALYDDDLASVPQDNMSEPRQTPPSDVDDSDATTQADDSATHIRVITDVLDVRIDTRGGTISRARLLNYPVKLDSADDVELLSSAADSLYLAQSGIIAANGQNAPTHKSVFSTQKTHYELAEDDDQIDVTLTWTDDNGLQVDKVYTFTRGSYIIDVDQHISNDTDTAWTGQGYQQLQRVEPPEPEYSNFMAKYSDTSRYSFFGGAWYSPDEKFNKVKLSKFDKSINGGAGIKTTEGWFAMEQAYFVGAWIPAADRPTVFTTLTLGSDDHPRYLIRGIGPVLNVAPGAEASDATRLFIGPKDPAILKTVTPSFDLALNYGVMTIVARPLHWVLANLHKITGNWGWAIVLLVLLINILFYKLYAIQYRSSAHMRRLKPRMDALKERYGGDRQKLQRAMMDMYKKEKVNPMAGCLPILITLPIFFGLYELLRESVELRQAPFIGWIQDLSTSDPYFVLPILYGVVMLIQSLTMPMSPGMDPTQQKMIRFMPVATALFFAFFPAGLALYYSINGVCRLLTMWWVYRQVDKEEARKKRDAKSEVSASS